MQRVVVVSNRVTDLAVARQAGGVAVAIADMLMHRPAIWLGWNGAITEPGSEDDTRDVTLARQSRIIKFPLTRDDFNGFYLGYANSVLWPVFHSRLDLAQFEAGFYDQYQAVNKKFAREVADVLHEDDIVWVHDYHFLTLAKELRALGVQNAIGLFLHIPVPPAQAFLAIPEHKELAEALTFYDLVGVQTQADVGNIIDVFQQAVFGQLMSNGDIRVANRAVRIGSYPVGIDVAALKQHSQQPADAPEHIRIVGVDRLDYTKGLPQKFRAYGKFLSDSAEFKGNVVLTQIAPPTREDLEAYSDIRAELENLAGAINGAHGDLAWSPVQYLHRTYDREQLFDIFRTSKVGLVTPLRDGMNLVAKEYVAVQDADDPGVLVLSRFAGAAEQLTDALIVNPYNVEETAGAIRTALEMPHEERQRRHQKLMQAIAKNDSATWSATFLTHLCDVYCRFRLDAHSEVLDKLVKSAGLQRPQPALNGNRP